MHSSNECFLSFVFVLNLSLSAICILSALLTNVCFSFPLLCNTIDILISILVQSIFILFYCFMVALIWWGYWCMVCLICILIYFFVWHVLGCFCYVLDVPVFYYFILILLYFIVVWSLCLLLLFHIIFCCCLIFVFQSFQNCFIVIWLLVAIFSCPQALASFPWSSIVIIQVCLLCDCGTFSIWVYSKMLFACCFIFLILRMLEVCFTFCFRMIYSGCFWTIFLVFFLLNPVTDVYF